MNLLRRVRDRQTAAWGVLGQSESEGERVNDGIGSIKLAVKQRSPESVQSKFRPWAPVPWETKAFKLLFHLKNGKWLKRGRELRLHFQSPLSFTARFHREASTQQDLISPAYAQGISLIKPSWQTHPPLRFEKEIRMSEECLDPNCVSNLWHSI